VKATVSIKTLTTDGSAMPHSVALTGRRQDLQPHGKHMYAHTVQTNAEWLAYLRSRDMSCMFGIIYPLLQRLQHHIIRQIDVHCVRRGCVGLSACPARQNLINSGSPIGGMIQCIHAAKDMAASSRCQAKERCCAACMQLEEWLQAQ